MLEILRKRKNFILYTTIKLFSLVIGFITSIIIVRGLTVVNYGFFSLSLMFVGLITTLGFSWSSSSIIYFGSKEKIDYGNMNKTFWARNIIIFISLIITTLLFVIFSKEINNYIGLELSFLILLWLYVSVFEDYLTKYFLATNNQMFAGFLSLTAKINYLILVLAFDFDVKYLIIMNIISHLSVIVYLFKVDKTNIGKFEFDKEWFLKVFNFSIWQLFGFSGLYLINFGDTFIINQFMTIEDVGTYNVAYKLFNTIASFAFVLSGFFAPLVVKAMAIKDSNKIKNIFYKERYLIFFTSLFGHIILIVFAQPIIETLYGTNYGSSVEIFQILMFGSIIRYYTVFYMIFYNAKSMHKKLQYLNIIRALLNLILDVILINLFGLIGPAIATSMAISTTFIYMYLDGEKEIKKTIAEGEIK